MIGPSLGSLLFWLSGYEFMNFTFGTMLIMCFIPLLLVFPDETPIEYDSEETLPLM